MLAHVLKTLRQLGFVVLFVCVSLLVSVSRKRRVIDLDVGRV
jgi:hypothetical protein